MARSKLVRRPGGGNLYTVSDTVHVNAPIERCFLLSTSIDLVALTLQMRPVEGKKTGLITMDDRILWTGWKFGLPQRHETLITGYDAPNFFQDTMGKGRFQWFQHDHSFTQIGNHTLLHDKVRFSLPFGILGSIVARQLMVPYIAGLVRRRFLLLKRMAESEGWRQYLPDQQ
ncbi:MAG: SRPBCC family protein [Acidobacteriota bacterium]|nr:SRPBCC family protein [Acidobacteriota bacterium]